MEENLIYRIDELTKKMDSVNVKIDKINEIINQFRMADVTAESEMRFLKERVNRLEEESHSMKKEIVYLKELPLKKDAQNWQTVVSKLFNTIMEIAILAFLIKLGLK